MAEAGSVLSTLDAFALRLIVPLAAVILVSGIDDLWIDVAWLWFWAAGRFRRLVAAPNTPERRIAIFVPLWREHEVILDMLAHNIGCVRYSNYQFFVGAYPNDPLTLEAIREAERRWSNVHPAVCPHDGPTSKADCLNWIYQRMLLYEESADAAFDLVVVHDAEDVMHPEELRLINTYSAEYDFIQIPVLPLATPVYEFTHGVYCDEFAQMHTRDMPVRSMLGGFVPSAGVGTGYSREALNRLAEAESNRVFDPACLTEDYENGFRLHCLGIKQIFLPLCESNPGPVATREYFPRTWPAAIRQRTRWITGIALQTWERHGWRGGWQAYWLWRDRKGLIGSPASAISSILFLYAVLTRMWTRVDLPAWMIPAVLLTLPLHAVRMAVRIGCSWRWFGPAFALLAPLREPYANVLNAWATVQSLCRYAKARWEGRPLVWVKTEHAYPSRAALLESRRRLGEILTGSSYLEPSDLELALAGRPEGFRLGEWLVHLGRISEDDLYEALSIQAGVPLGRAIVERMRLPAVRTLPAEVARHWRVLPFEIREGELYIAGPEQPAVEMESALRAYTSLRLRFHLVTPGEYAEMERKFSAN
jgi:bacteriophage N4 adsorption protein B